MIQLIQVENPECITISFNGENNIPSIDYTSLCFLFFL